MLVGIHNDPPYGKFHKYLKRYEQILKFNKIQHLIMDVNDSDFWMKVGKLSLFIFRWLHYDDPKQLAKTILPIIENEFNIKCFPNRATYWHYDDKIRQFYLLKQKGFPTVESWVFWNKKKAIEWVKSATYPLVFKLSGGAGSLNVILIKNEKEALRIIGLMFGRGIVSGRIPSLNMIKYKHFDLYANLHRIGGNLLRKLRDEDIYRYWQLHKNYILFQRFLKGNEFDTRVAIIGNRAFGFRRFNRKNDFRASGSGKIDYSTHYIDKRAIKLAFNVSECFNFQSMAYDIIYDEDNNPVIIEISYDFIDKAIYNCDGYWDRDLNWHGGHFMPQYLHLIDTLCLPDLKQPKYDTLITEI